MNEQITVLFSKGVGCKKSGPPKAGRLISGDRKIGGSIVLRGPGFPVTVYPHPAFVGVFPVGFDPRPIAIGGGAAVIGRRGIVGTRPVGQDGIRPVGWWRGLILILIIIAAVAIVVILRRLGIILRWLGIILGRLGIILRWLRGARAIAIGICRVVAWVVVVAGRISISIAGVSIAIAVSVVRVTVVRIAPAEAPAQAESPASVTPTSIAAVVAAAAISTITAGVAMTVIAGTGIATDARACIAAAGNITGASNAAGITATADSGVPAATDASAESGAADAASASADMTAASAAMAASALGKRGHSDKEENGKENIFHNT
jgi:hypothetical protein